MKLKDFITANADILRDPVAPDELKDITEGTPLFMAAVRNGLKPKDERIVAMATWAAPLVNSTDDASGRSCLTVAGVTKKGYAELYSVWEQDLQPDGRIALFRMSPLAQDDPRHNLQPLEWPQ